jgi:O-antigen/teichoic acid export membrane protein
LRHESSLRRVVRLGKEAVWAGTGQALMVFSAVIAVPLLTSVLTPTEYGELALAMSGFSLVQQLAFAPVSSAALRYFSSSSEANRLPPYLAAIVRLLGRSSRRVIAPTIVAACVLLFAGQADLMFLLVGTATYAVVAGINSSLESIQIGARHRAAAAMHQGLGHLSRVLLAWTAARILGGSATMTRAGYAVATIVLFGSEWRYVRRIAGRDTATTVNRESTANLEDRLHDYGRPFVLWSAFTWMWTAADRWSLQLFAGAESVGLYAVLYQIGYGPLIMATALLEQLIAPVLFGHAGDASDRRRLAAANQICNRLVVVGLAGTASLGVAAYLLHGELFAVVAPGYASISALLPLLVISAGLFSCGQLTALRALIAGRSDLLVKPKIVSAIVGITVSIAAAAIGGIPAVAAGGIISSALYLILTLLAVEASEQPGLHYPPAEEPKVIPTS